MMRFLDLHISAQMTDKGRLSAYKGSMLRGAMGSALKKTCCNIRSEDCSACIISGVCPFPKLFVAERTENGRAKPPLYAVIPCDDGRTDFAAGDRLDFGLKLYAHATDYLPYFVRAVTLAGELGLGKRNENGRGTFSVKGIYCGGTNLYEPSTQKLSKAQAEDLIFPQWQGACQGSAFVRVDFLTPCRFKRDNFFSHDLSFRELCLLAVRRYRGLALLDGEQYAIDDFDGFLEEAGTVCTIGSDLHWKDWTRWSNRQGKPCSWAASPAASSTGGA